jgi:hypothetical protein
MLIEFVGGVLSKVDAETAKQDNIDRASWTRDGHVSRISL